MATTSASERRLLTDDELDPILTSTPPVLESLSRQELLALARWLRGHQARLRNVTRRRVRRGKAAIGGVPEEGSEPGLAAKHQVFAPALKRVNGRLTHLQAEAERAHDLAALQDALARRAAPQALRPGPGASTRPGMANRPAARTRAIISGRRVGSVSQAGKYAQAARDQRGAR